MVLRRVVKGLLCLVLAAIGVLAATIISAPLWIRPLIAWQAAASFARPVSIGHLGLRLGDPVSVTAEDVVIGNPDGFARNEEPLLRIPRLTVLIEVAASVRHLRIVITSIELDRPLIHATATEDGRENYRLSSASRPHIGTLSVWDGRAHISLAHLHADLDVTFATKQEADARRIVAEARGIYAGEPVVARFAGDLPSETNGAWPVEIAVENGPTKASMKGTLQDLFSIRGAAIDFAISGPDMARLRPFTGVPFPVTPPYELSGRLDCAEGIYRVTKATGRLGRSELEGTMTVATPPGQRLEMTANILSRSVDLRDIASLLGSQPGRPETPGQTAQQQVEPAQIEKKTGANPRVLPQAPLQVAKFDWANVHLAFRAQRIQSASMPFDNFSVNMDVVDGNVALHQFSVGIGQGQISGDIWLTPRTNEAMQARADVDFERADVSRLLWASRGYRGNGALNGAMHVDGTGRSIADIVAGADGDTSLWMMGGDLSSLLVDLAGLRLGSALVASLNGKPTTKVECFVADLALRRGILSTRTLRLETEDSVTEGTGVVDLRNERVDIRLRTQSKHLTIGVVPAPLLITGSLKDLQAGPDPATPAGRGGLAGALAALPTVQLGVGDTWDCQSVVRQIRKG